MGPPKQEDPNYVWLQEAGLTLARRVFHPAIAWPTKYANAFIAKNLTLFKSPRQELKRDLRQDDFLKVHKSTLVIRLH